MAAALHNHQYRITKLQNKIKKNDVIAVSYTHLVLKRILVIKTNGFVIEINFIY